MTWRNKKILITCALPYANGPLHIGHLVEHIQADIYSRFLKLTGHDVLFLCASDVHGTPIEINATKLGVTPQDFVTRYHNEHKRDLARFGIAYDYFYTTDSAENRHFTELIFKRLQAAGHILKKETELAYCNHCQRFLPDRYVRGICPKCKAENQYGDVCEVCNSTYEPTDLIDPRCSTCNNQPVTKKSLHYFFKVSDFAPRLQEWITTDKHVQPSVQRFIEQWFITGLKDWAISRDRPYFGFTIPGETDKYIYVWLDAPIGYISTTAKFCALHGKSFEEYWYNPDSVILHFIGKDIIYFHTLFWPAVLMGAGFQLPERIHVHGMLRVDGQKMSKSRGTFINAETLADHIDPQYLRYYYASKYTADIDDLDLNLQDFVLRVNAELVNKIANLVSRVVPFVEKNFEGWISVMPDDCSELLAQVDQHVKSAESFYAELEIGKALKEIVAVAEIGNKYFQDTEPWKLIRTDKERVRRIATFALHCARITAILIKPILPKFSDEVAAILNVPPFAWNDATTQLRNCHVGPFIRLIDRLEIKAIEAIITETLHPGASEQEPTSNPVSPPAALQSIITEPPESNLITIDDLAKIDLRVGKVLKAEEVPGAAKLLKLTIDDGSRQRTVFAGIKLAYSPESLIGKNLLLVANLTPRKMKFGISEGMILAAGDETTVVVAEFCGSIAAGAAVH